MKDGDTWFVAIDTCAVLEHSNSAWRSAHITPRKRINAALSARCGEDAVDDAIASLVADGFVIAEDDYVLALPLRQPGWRRAPSWDDLLRGQPVLA